MERSNGDFGRGNGRDNGMIPQPTTSTSGPQPVRQDDEWSVPPTANERNNAAERPQVTQISPPATSPPTEERLFTDWSSEDSPRERVNQRLQSTRSIESRRTVSQMEQIETRGDEEERHVPESVMMVPSTREQMNQVGTHTTAVEIRLLGDEVRTDVIQTHNQGIQVPSSSGGLSSHSMSMEESLVRSHVPNVMPQLGGPTSVRVQRRQPLPIARRTTTPGDGYHNDSDSDFHNNRFCEDRRYLGRRRYHQERGGRSPDRGNNQG